MMKHIIKFTLNILINVRLASLLENLAQVREVTSSILTSKYAI